MKGSLDDGLVMTIPIDESVGRSTDVCDDGDEQTTWGFCEQSEIVPGYFAWDLLGVGRRFEMWIVWCADRLAPVCLKIPRRDERTERTHDAMRRELDVATSFDHPAIPRVYDSDLAGEPPFIAYEFIEGVPLSLLIEDDGPLASNDLLLTGLQIAVALRHIHSRGFVHLDLKPANISIRGDRVVVLDFDISLPIGGQRSRTKPRGTRWYMAPEQIRCEPAQPSMDIFALGAVLYEAATATLAFDVDTTTGDDETPIDPEVEQQTERPYRQLGGPLRPAVESAPHLWPALGKAIDSMLEPKPDDRPASVSEAIDLLVSALPPDGEPLWPNWVNGLIWRPTTTIR